MRARMILHSKLPVINYYRYECMHHIKIQYYSIGSRDSVVGITTSYGLNDRGVEVRVPVGSRIFTSPNRPDWL
jgi:hypothetical protein